MIIMWFATEYDFKNSLVRSLTDNRFLIFPRRRNRMWNHPLYLNHYLPYSDLNAYKEKVLYIIELKNKANRSIPKYLSELDRGIIQLLRYRDETLLDKVLGIKKANTYNEDSFTYYHATPPIEIIVKTVEFILIGSDQSDIHERIIQRYNLPIKLIVYNEDCPL